MRGEVAWTALSSRLSALPVVLAGPILRRVEPGEVTVWVALKESHTVTLDVFEGTGGARTKVATGNRATVQLGTSLHVVAVTALPATGGQDLAPGKVYFYDLELDNGKKLASPGMLTSAGSAAGLTYHNDDLPSFSLPPTNMDDVRLAHASCRKPHAPGMDALVAVDLMLKEAAVEPLPSTKWSTEADFARRRPHQLYLTGDQIYADDVADVMLAMLTDAESTLLGWSEILPGTGGKKASDFKPGKRADLTIKTGKLTSGIPDATKAKSHLLALGEFYAMYLFVWGEALWPAFADLPTVPDAPEEERDRVGAFMGTIGDVRRLLANVPTYMIFDDHEVTDDWYLNRLWCKSNVRAGTAGGAVDTALTQRLILNALLAYAVFQAWGNTSSLFAASGSAGDPGRKLLQAAADWSAAKGDASSAQGAAALSELKLRLGLPTRALSASDTTLARAAGALPWHFRVAFSGCPFEVIVLDGRTMRSYDPSLPEIHGAGLISDDGLAAQLDGLPAPPADGPTIVVAPGPVLGIPWIEEKQAGSQGDKVWDRDVEAWGLHPHAFQSLIARLADRQQRVLLLSGDVHYSFVARMIYWAKHPYARPVRPARSASLIVQFTSSAVRNEDYGLTSPDRQHKGGYNHFYGTLAWMGVPANTGPPADVAGWNVPPGAGKVTIGTQVTGGAFWRHRVSLIRTPPALLNVVGLPSDTAITLAEDWRYQINWLHGTKAPVTTTPPTPLTLPTDPLKRTLAIHEFQRDFRASLINDEGRDIVGHNNCGELTFDWPSSARQTLWWRPLANSPPVRTTWHDLSLDPADPAMPTPLAP